MKALVLSGGKGTRLRPITHTMAKQLVPVANRPILHYCLDNILNAGINDIGIVISPETGEDVIHSVNAWLKDNSCNVTFIRQIEPSGLAHAVKISEDYLKDDDFVMYLGDNLIKQDIKELVQKFKENQSDAMILLKEVENPKMFGVANIKGNKIVKLEEKPENPKSNLALVGVYLFNSNIHKAVNAIKPSKRGEFEITEAIQYMLDHSYNVSHHILEGWWLDTGKKDDLLGANRIVLDEYTEFSQKGEVDSKSCIEGRVKIAKGSKLTNTTVRGPVVIGENCIINNAYIGPYTSISNSVVIENSEIEYSVVMHNSSITNIKKRIAESLIASNVKIICSQGTPHTHKFLIGDDSDIILNEGN